MQTSILVYNYYQATFQELRCNLEKIEIHDHTTTTNSISTQHQHQAAPTTSTVYADFYTRVLRRRMHYAEKCS
jgi:hypothetical protein